MTNYVLGFAFSESMKYVALILKNKPDWQREKLNGIGGKIEQGETPLDAMVREFKEEAGLATTPDQWKHFARMRGTDFTVEVFAADEIPYWGIKSMESEMVGFVPVDGIVVRKGIVENVPWLVGLARDHLVDGRPQFTSIAYP